MRRRGAKPPVVQNVNSNVNSDEPIGWAELIEQELELLDKAIERFIEQHYAPNGRYKPYLPTVRLPNPKRVGDRIEIELIWHAERYISSMGQWCYDVPIWHITVCVEKKKGRRESYRAGNAYVGKRIIPYLTPRQVHELIKVLREYRAWFEARCEGLRRAEQEILKQQAQAVEVLNAELAMLALKEEDLSL